MRFDVVSVLPELIRALEDDGVVGRAFRRGKATLRVWNPRDFVSDTHRTIDARPYGGGPGMVLMAEPLARVLDAIAASQRALTGRVGRVVLMSPAGRRFEQMDAQRWRDESLVARSDGTGFAVTLLCGRYEGIDQRLIDARVDQSLSLGDFVLSGGELAAMAMIDAAVRLLPGVLNDEGSAVSESFAPRGEGPDGRPLPVLLDCPQYTRPEHWRGQAVPDVLLSGDHARIERWRRSEAEAATRRLRPDL